MVKHFIIQVYSRDGSVKVGKISKQWSGLVREAFTDADMFGINFPLDLDVKIKAVLLGACFLIVSVLYGASLQFIIEFNYNFFRTLCSLRKLAMKNGIARACCRRNATKNFNQDLFKIAI